MRNRPARPLLWGLLSAFSILLVWAIGLATRAAIAWTLPAFVLLTPAALGFGVVAIVRNARLLRAGAEAKDAIVVGLVAGCLGVLMALFTLWMFLTPADRVGNP